MQELLQEMIIDEDSKNTNVTLDMVYHELFRNV